MDSKMCFLGVMMALSLVLFQGVGWTAEKEVVSAPSYSGFLGDYSALTAHPDKDRAGDMVYLREGADLSKYSKVLLEKPVVQLNELGKTREVPEDEWKKLSDFFMGSLKSATKKECTLVKRRGPGVLVVRTSISDAIPQRGKKALLLKAAVRVVNLDKGGTTIEAELVDGESGERLMASVEMKSGGRLELGFGGSKRWGHARKAFSVWSEDLVDMIHPDDDTDQHKKKQGYSKY
jgi:hypothetical protein